MADQEHADPEQASSAGSSTRPLDGYGEFVADALLRQTGDLGRSWARRGAAAVGNLDAGAGRADAAPDLAPVEQLVRTLALAAAEESQWHERVMRTGWTTGTDAMRRGTSLNQLLKELDGGVTLVLSAADAATRNFEGPTTALDGLALARRIVDAASLLRLAAAGGYTRAMVDDLRQRYRTIRHDLRNPLGTITTAVALMDDESVPEETRQHPRVRAMVARNVRSMDAMISATLGDPAAQLPAIAMQTTSLRALACAVQGDLRATVNGVDVVVGDALPTFPFDSAGLELLLKAVVMAMARSNGRGVAIGIDLADLRPSAATLSVFAAGGGGAEAGMPDLSFAGELAMRLGGSVTPGRDGTVLIDVPIERVALLDRSATPRRRADDAREVDDSDGNAGDDVARARERVNGEPRVL